MCCLQWRLDDITAVICVIITKENCLNIFSLQQSTNDTLNIRAFRGTVVSLSLPADSACAGCNFSSTAIFTI